MIGKKYFFLAVLGGVLISLVSFILDFRAKKYYEVHAPKVEVMEVEARELLELKNMFKDKKKIKREIEVLKRIKSPSKEYKKGGNYILEFEGLNRSSLKIMLRKILNSTLKLRVFRVVREKEGASLYLEIER